MPHRNQSPSENVTQMVMQRLRDAPYNCVELIIKVILQNSEKETTTVYHLLKIETDAYIDFF